MAEIVSNLNVRGAIGQRELPKGKAAVEKDLDFSDPQDYVFDFTLVQQGGIFTVPVSMFLDNSVNPKPVEVYVDQTGQYFPVPPYSSGWFTLTANENSKITLSSVGGVEDNEKCYVAFVNYEVAPQVWNGFAPLVDGARVKIIGVNGITDQGATNPIIVGGNNGGAPVPIQVDGQGRISVIGSAAGGVSYGPDAAGVTTTRAPNVIAGVDPGGLVRRALTTLAGLLRVSVDASILPAGASTEATLAALKSRGDLLATEATLTLLKTRNDLLATEATLLALKTRNDLLATEATLSLIKTATDAIKVNSDRPANAATTSPANAIASFTILAANANRKGGAVTVEGAPIKLKLGSAASNTDYTVSLAVGDYYELPFNYTGIVTGISASATGNLRVTEIS